MHQSTHQFRIRYLAVPALLLLATGCAGDDSSSTTDVPRSTVSTVSTVGTEPDSAPSTTVQTTTPSTVAGTDDTTAAPDPTEPPTVDEVLATLTDLEIRAVGSIECARELVVIGLAAEAYQAAEGAPPDDLAAVEQYAAEPIERWVWDADAGDVAPAPESGCNDPEAFGAVSRCAAEQRTVASLAALYEQQFGEPPTMQDLIDVSYIAAAPTDVDLVDGAVVATATGDCVDLITDEISPPDDQACETERRTLEVAVQAYVAQFGTPPAAPTDLVAEGLLRMAPTLYVADGETVVARPNAGCD